MARFAFCNMHISAAKQLCESLNPSRRKVVSSGRLPVGESRELVYYDLDETEFSDLSAVVLSKPGGEQLTVREVHWNECSDLSP